MTNVMYFVYNIKKSPRVTAKTPPTINLNLDSGFKSDSRKISKTIKLSILR